MLVLLAFLSPSRVTDTIHIYRARLVHRNINVGCLRVRDGGTDSRHTAGVTHTKTVTPSRLEVRLGDYWCFQNPRKAGCVYSLGRGDWGEPRTAPPEALGLVSGPSISDKSDVWALGMCAFYWATGGLYPDAQLLQQVQARGSDEPFRSRVPLCWGAWLPAMLLMCLQRQPQSRASAEHIHNFLQKSRYKVVHHSTATTNAAM